jgi:hypothetical protein
MHDETRLRGLVSADEVPPRFRPILESTCVPLEHPVIGMSVRSAWPSFLGALGWPRSAELLDFHGRCVVDLNRGISSKAARSGSRLIVVRAAKVSYARN